MVLIVRVEGVTLVILGEVGLAVVLVVVLTEEAGRGKRW